MKKLRTLSAKKKKRIVGVSVAVLLALVFSLIFLTPIVLTITNSFMMPIVAILTCIFIGYVIKVSFISDEVESEGNAFLFKRPFEYMIKYVCPICLAAILIFGTLDMFGIYSVY